MTVTGTIVSSPATLKSGNIPGLGFMAVVTVVMDSAMTQTGELLDLSAIFPSYVWGGVPIKDTLNDGGFKFSYVSGASTASGLIQAYGNPAAATSGPLVLLSDGADISAVNGQTWLFLGQ